MKLPFFSPDHSSPRPALVFCFFAFLSGATSIHLPRTRGRASPPPPKLSGEVLSGLALRRRLRPRSVEYMNGKFFRSLCAFVPLGGGGHRSSSDFSSSLPKALDEGGSPCLHPSFIAACAVLSKPKGPREAPGSSNCILMSDPPPPSAVDANRGLLGAPFDSRRIPGFLFSPCAYPPPPRNPEVPPRGNPAGDLPVVISSLSPLLLFFS